MFNWFLQLGMSLINNLYFLSRMSVVRPTEQRISWQEKRRILTNLYGRGGLVVVCETGVVVHEAPPNSPTWNVEDYGVPTIISNLTELVISIVDFDTAEPHREYSITAECDYKVQKNYFHTFICEDDDGSDLLVGLSFANSEVARRVAEAVDQLTPGKLFKSEEKVRSLNKDAISQPSDFKHLGHIGSELPVQADPISGLSALEKQTGNGVSSVEVSTEEIGSSPQQNNIKPSPPQGKDISKANCSEQGTKIRKPHGLYNQAKRLMSSASQTKKPQKGARRVLEIGSPMEFKHVAHMGGENCFAPKNDDGHEDPFQMSGEFVIGDRKRSSSPEQVSGGEEMELKKSRVPMDISSPKDFKHVAHVSKDTAISAFLLTGQRDPFSIVNAIANSPSPPKQSFSPPTAPAPPNIPIAPEPPSLPTVQPPEPRKITSPPKIHFPPPPPQIHHSDFLREISAFKPSFLRHVSRTQKEPVRDPNSLQEVLKSSFENMRGKLQDFWRDSIVTTFAEQQDGDGEDEFDYPGVYLPEEVRNELEQ